MINEKDLFIKASALWGIGFQFEMAKEELAELIVSISHYQRGKENQPNLVKEIVDVQILINQLRAMLYGHYAGNNKSFPDFVQKEERCAF